MNPTSQAGPVLPSQRRMSPWTLLPAGALFSFLGAIAAVIVLAFAAERASQVRVETRELVGQSARMQELLQGLLTALRDAETGQRGYLLTGVESYLEPYHAARLAIPNQILAIRDVMSADADQRRRLVAIETSAKEKIDELGQTIELKRAGDNERAMNVVRSDRGKLLMDDLRKLVGQMQAEQAALLERRQNDWRDAVDLAQRISWIGYSVLFVLIAMAAVMTSRDYRARQTNAWLRTGRLTLAEKLQGDQRIEQLSGALLAFLVDYLDAKVGAIYVVSDGGRLQRQAGHALTGATERAEILFGEGLVGQAAKENRLVHAADVPDGYFHIASATGSANAREVLIAPAAVNGVVHAVLELGFFRRVDSADKELLTGASELLGIAVRSARDRTRLEELLEETQRQAEELQAQQEELRVNNEELEEQGNSLKLSQQQMEAQQVELEQTNAQLEEQAQLLENQKDELTVTQQAIAAKAAELERSNQYKSEFLANMSHELRTPLNSTLILAKLLADNKDGNLSGEQVKFAQTITSAGNDLLALINDILDLSKIEAGKVEVNPERFSVKGAAEEIVKPLKPLAQEKGLTLELVIAPDAPAELETDPHRLGQILKNLISNALKFTRQGEVKVRVAAGSAEDTIAFEVHDTGIGIPPEQQEVIFEAFRQADGSTHRRYGGSGLGLSISRDLAHRLGGRVAVSSTVGKGSVFTLVMPLHYKEPAADDARPHASAISGPAAYASSAGAAAYALSGNASMSPSNQSGAASAANFSGTRGASAADDIAAAGIDDDRAHLSPEGRVILVIEDDVAFAGILRDLARDMHFQCVVTHSAKDGIAAAARYKPSAIVLDMHLPDQSGMNVLEQLKRDPRTRHIPVHVASVADYAHEALERGAVGYALKPVKREELVDVMKRLEAKFSQSVRRVLIVEDDATQRESMRQLLGHRDTQIVVAANAAEAMDRLRETTFDCMVMDLNLPDMSGYDLLEKMAAENAISFPPVIVYTGRNLKQDEEQRLRRYSRSIIIKDARSPERLLDEVTLFLHQVESQLPAESQRMLKAARNRETAFEGRRILVVEDDVRNIFALSSVLEPKGTKVEIARNGKEALDALAKAEAGNAPPIDLVLMDIMMPEMDGITAMRLIRAQPALKSMPIIALTAKAMKDDHEKCLAAGANDYIAKPLDVERLLSLIRVWMPK